METKRRKWRTSEGKGKDARGRLAYGKAGSGKERRRGRRGEMKIGSGGKICVG